MIPCKSQDSADQPLIFFFCTCPYKHAKVKVRYDKRFCVISASTTVLIHMDAHTHACDSVQGQQQSYSRNTLINLKGAFNACPSPSGLLKKLIIWVQSKVEGATRLYLQ